MLNKESNTPNIHHHPMQQMPYGLMMHPSSSSSSSPIPPGSFNINKDAAGIIPNNYDLGELDQAFFQYLDGQNQTTPPYQQDQQQPCSPQDSEMRPHTLNIFPSQPMHIEPSPTASKTNNDTSGSGLKILPHESSSSMEHSNPKNGGCGSASAPPNPEKTKVVKREGNHKGPTSIADQQGPKTPDPKTLRRLAQNREAARKSRLRKKAYVQQLESSRIRLTQLEQEIQKARSQGFFLGGNAFLPGDQGLPIGSINSDAALFDMEYGRWLEEHHRLTVMLRNAVEEHFPENELRGYVDNCLAHYGQVMSLKHLVAKSDVFHILSGMWKTPAERCFLWIGGFRPSEIIKVMVREIEGVLTEQQMAGICGLRQTTHEAEEALNQGLEALNQSISETLISESLTQPAPSNINTYMTNMATAINKLEALDAFLGQADNLRQQTLHRLHQTLTTRQSARCFLAMAEYFHRLRALSGLWLARPRTHQ